MRSGVNVILDYFVMEVHGDCVLFFNNDGHLWQQYIVAVLVALLCPTHTGFF